MSGSTASPPFTTVLSTSRLEAFSDGVIAVAITLLALDLPIPATGTPRLADYLGTHWQSFAAFVVSFLTIGIVWVNHHAMIKRIIAVDNTILLLNLVLLMTICVLPYTTALMAHYLRASHGENLAAATWSASFLLMSIAFMAIQRHLMITKTHLLHERITPTIRQTILRRNATGIIPYALACAAAPLTAYGSLAICATVAIYYALPSTTALDNQPTP